MRWVVSAISLAMVLSGCFGGGKSGSDDTGGDGGADDGGMNTTEPPEPIITTNTFWFGEAPSMSYVPLDDDEVREPMPPTNFFFFGGGQGGGGQDESGRWEIPLDGTGNMTGGLVHVTIDVVEQLLNPPPIPFPFGGDNEACTWRVQVILTLSDNPAASDVQCVNDSATTINAGEIELDFEFEFESAIPREGNMSLVVDFGREPFSTSQNEAVFILAGTADYESYIRVDGLLEPVPDA
jgi:hypothetical protein